MNRITFVLLAGLLPVAIASARATSEHTYVKAEYVTVRDGVAPNKKLALAAHGDGDGGHDNFHVWLMAEPAHRKLMSLEAISSNNNLDTSADAYWASWGADSRHVGVNFRSDRHVVELNLYAIEDHGGRLVNGPSLFKEATSRDVGSGDDMWRSVSTVEWKAPDRFVLTETRLFVAADDHLAKLLGRFGNAEKLDDGRFSIQFAAEADCLLLPGYRYRVVDLRVGKFSSGDD